MTIDDIRLSDDFLTTYRGRQPKWGFDGLGWVIFLRTYARKKDDGTLEEWSETVQRFTEGNYRAEAERLAELGKLDDDSIKSLNAEMERFYHLAFNLVLTPPGRGIWISGTDYEKRSGDALNNCWFVSMRPQSYAIATPPAVGMSKPSVAFAACFTFDQAMKGGGVGVNVQRHNVSQIPRVNNKLTLHFVCRHDHADYKSELFGAGVGPSEYIYPHVEYLTVDDSREGWTEALRSVIESHYEGKHELVIDLSLIRPRGTPIRGFGGVASGPAPLVRMLVGVNEILNRRVGDYVTPVEWGDVIQLIGTCVIAGNVRRTALILIGDQNDQAFVESKNYSLPQNAAASQWRWASNNSVDIDGASLDVIRDAAKNIYYNGEPGIVRIDLARNTGRIIDGWQDDIDAEVEGYNPCAEVTLPNGSPCNLFEISLPRIEELIRLGYEDESLYDEAAKLGVRYAYRVTFRKYDWDVTRNVVQRHRRLGVGITGVTDWVLLKFGERAIRGFDDNGDPIFNHDITSYLDRMYRAGREANVEHAKTLQAYPSIKITTVKPSGTMSLLMGVSPGMHWHWAPYMIRRVRMSASSPLVDTLRDCGYTIEYAQTGNDSAGNAVYDFTTVVVEFPVKAPTADHPLFQSAGDVPLREQAALQALLATYWSDNAVSATLSFYKAQPKPVFFEDGRQLTDKFNAPVVQVDQHDEQRVIDEIADVIERYKGVIKSTSLLPYATGTYPQMPYEAITKERYDALVAKLTAKPWDLIGPSVMGDNDALDESTECVGGHCGVR